MTACYLLFSGDSPEQAQKYASKASAIGSYARVALELAKFGQVISAYIFLHEMTDCPDFILELGPYGGVKVTRN